MKKRTKNIYIKSDTNSQKKNIYTHATSYLEKGRRETNYLDQFWLWWRCQQSYRILEPWPCAGNNYWRHKKHEQWEYWEDNTAQLIEEVHNLHQHCKHSPVLFAKLDHLHHFWLHTMLLLPHGWLTYCWWVVVRVVCVFAYIELYQYEMYIMTVCIDIGGDVSIYGNAYTISKQRCHFLLCWFFLSLIFGLFV